eukprot:gene3452-3781_t
MTDYWVSQSKYYCKFCKCYMADNKPSRQHHENGVKHKQNVELFMKQQRQEKLHGAHSESELKRQLAEIERAARAAMASTDSLPPPPPPPMSSTSTRNAPSIQSTIESSGEENSGIYQIRGKVYLDGRIFEQKLRTGCQCEIFVEALDEWLEAEVTRRVEIVIPHTQLTLCSFDVRYSIPGDVVETVEEKGVKSDRLRIVASSEMQEEVIKQQESEEPIPPKISEETGIGSWQTVSVREIDQAKEDEERAAFESHRQTLIDEMNKKDQTVLTGKQKDVTVDSAHFYDPHRDPNVKVYKGFTLEPTNTANKLLADGEIVTFRKRKPARQVVEEAESKEPEVISSGVSLEPSLDIAVVDKTAATATSIDSVVAPVLAAPPVAPVAPVRLVLKPNRNIRRRLGD